MSPFCLVSSASEVDQVISSVDKRIKRSRFSIHNPLQHGETIEYGDKKHTSDKAQVKSSRRDLRSGSGGEGESSESEEEEEEDEDAGGTHRNVLECVQHDFEPQDDTMIEMTEGDTMILFGGGRWMV